MAESRVRVIRCDGVRTEFHTLSDAVRALDIPAARIVRHAMDRTPSEAGLRFELLDPVKDVSMTFRVQLKRSEFSRFESLAHRHGCAPSAYAAMILREVLDTESP